jgi:hypothetical protein
MEKVASTTPRPFNAQVYDIPSAEYCRVLMQVAPGETSIPVVAWFSRNGYHKPAWLRIGAAVQCQYKLDGRGGVEVFGPGTVIPTPVAGALEPVIPTPADGVMVGGQILAIP